VSPVQPSLLAPATCTSSAYDVLLTMDTCEMVDGLENARGMIATIAIAATASGIHHQRKRTRGRSGDRGLRVSVSDGTAVLPSAQVEGHSGNRDCEAERARDAEHHVVAP